MKYHEISLNTYSLIQYKIKKVHHVMNHMHHKLKELYKQSRGH